MSREFDTSTVEKIIESKLSDANTVLGRMSGPGGYSPSEPEHCALILSTLDMLFDKNDIDFYCDTITDGDGDASMDAIYIGRKEVSFFDFKYTKKNFLKADYTNIKSDLSNNVFGCSPTEELNQRVVNKISKIRSQSHSGKPKKLYIVRPLCPTSESKWVGELRQDFNNFDFSVEFINRDAYIKRNFKDKNRYSGDIAFKSQKVGEMGILKRHLGNTAEEYFGLIEVKYILSALTKASQKGESLFHANIRSNTKNVQLKRALRQTLISDRNKFYQYHNGVTITTSKKITYDGSNFVIKQPQVLNGLQTLSALESLVRNGEPMNSVWIFVKVVCENDEEKVELLCQSANTQISVKKWDLRSNDDIARSLEVLFDTSLPRYSYLRKTGQQKERGKKAVKNTDLFQWVCAAVYEKPAFAKNGKAAIFDIDPKVGIYRDVAKIIEGMSANEIGLLCDAYYFIVEQTKTETSKHNKSLVMGARLHILAGMYRVRCVDVGVYGKIRSHLIEAYKQHQETSPEVTPTKFFAQREETWEELKSFLDDEYVVR